MVDIENTRELLVKKPFRRILPSNNGYPIIFNEGNTPQTTRENMSYEIVSQSDFIREYYPSGHKINSIDYYPDITREDPESGKKYVEIVDRCTFAFQRTIVIKNLVHLCGNSIQFENITRSSNQEATKTFFDFRAGWAQKNMEVAWYNSAKSVKITGDTALVGYKYNGKFGCKVLSFLNGDILYPHHDNLTGELEFFARLYSDYDTQGKTVTDWLEVWDNAKIYRYKRSLQGLKGMITKFKNLFRIEGFSLVSENYHGFSSIPVAYHRDDDGSCWSPSQNSIDLYELAFSRMSQNNAATAFPIIYFKGDDVDIHGDIMRGTVTSISMGKDDEAGFLNRQDVSSAFIGQLDKLYKMIFEQSFAVIPPELKSGDLPGVAIKLLYSPAYENAIKDAQEYKPFINKVVKIFKEGYGWESGQSSKFNILEVESWIKPYIHQNWTETITNLATAVQNGFLSKERASEVADEYSTPEEWDRIIKEMKQQQEDEIQKQIEIEKTKTIVKQPETE